MSGNSSAVASEGARLVLTHGGNHVGSNRLAAANGIYTFVGLGFEVDFVTRQTERLAQCRAHLRKMPSELGAFADYDRIHMNDAETAVVEHFGCVLKGLVHLVAHFALHRGQISYIARMVADQK